MDMDILHRLTQDMKSDYLQVAALGRPMELGMLYNSLDDTIVPDMKSDYLQVAALGRPMELGMLYNSLADTIVPGITLWEDDVMQRSTKVTPVTNTRFHIAASDSLSEKTSMLEVSASLKASFFCGLVEVGGSAHYLNNKTSSMHQSRATFGYKETTAFKQLLVSGLEVQYPEVFDKAEATHIIIGVLYGANAFMVFEETASEESTKQDIQGNLNVMIKKIPFIKVSGEGKVVMNDDDIKNVKNFSCTFIGDFKPKNNPTTYEEAVLLFKYLPTMLKDGELGVPQKVWLYPLMKLNDKATQLKHQITDPLVSDVEQVLEELHEAEMRTNDLIKKSKGIQATDIEEKLELFQCKREECKFHFMVKVAELLPAIRGSTQEEKALTDILKLHDESPFNKSNMKHWLDGKEAEVGVVTSYIDSLEDVTIVAPGPDLTKLLYNPQIKGVFVFNFTSLQYEEPYLNSLDSISVGLHTASTQEEQPWYAKPGIKHEMLSTLTNFKFYKGHHANPAQSFIISYISDPAQPGTSLRFYVHGDHVSTNMESVTVAEIGADRVTLKLPLLQQVTFRMEYMDSENMRQTVETKPNQEQVAITGLRPGPNQISVAMVLPDGDSLQLTAIQVSTADACKLTLDLNTTHRNLSLSEGNRKVTYSEEQQQPYPDHPERFDGWKQVLCREALSTRCYWEVEMSGVAKIAVTYKGISRKGEGDDSGFGFNDKSWFLELNGKIYKALHNNIWTRIPAPPSASVRVRVYLDWPAGTLTFYSVSSDTLTHIHTFHSRFTEPLYAGIGFWTAGSWLSLCVIK